jgi:NAD-dependent deacetylase
MTLPISTSLEQLVEILREAKHPVALTGAGLSAESGIPTYRGPDGEWTRFGEPTIDGWELFQQNPADWWAAVAEAAANPSRFALALRDAVPNPGHLAMAELEQLGHLRHVITQNIDDLHRRAGTLALTEIHGNHYLARCTNCGEKESMGQVALTRLPPLCLMCGGTLKTDVVMFGEPIPDAALRECYRQAFVADVFLVIGTSAVVYPAAQFPLMAKERGVPLIEINPGETDLSPLADIVIRAPAGEALPALVEKLKASRGRG